MEYIDINKLITNEKNPRKISKENMDRLIKSIEEDFKFLEKRPLLVYPLGDRYIVYAGNMRLQACKQLGFKEIPCEIDNDIVDTKTGRVNETILQRRLFADNESFGEYDLDLLGQYFDVETIKSFDFPEIGSILKGMEELQEEFSGTNKEVSVSELGEESVIVFKFPHSQYLALLQTMQNAKEKLDCETNEDLLLRLLDEYV